ncbi:epoxide hydrolase-like protein [Streptomyces sp. Amel2xB2]|uniref:epoxide hydrolase family protein n=1 Tax=Streptomyces sp. Amel2xB2 TaxID=1305829 RepID=UPI000DB9AE9D|nr:epoxide hydrolase family protein [Streptomyces sp. Amel2xB2]RAJ58949.1 epoxide hydrolase-like protein [Streptomyces sp. Amel2xB2]
MTAEPFPLESVPIHVPDRVLEDLRDRLARTRSPVDEANEDWPYGVPRSYLEELVAYWADGFDWRRAEAALNAYPQHQVTVDGVPVHFLRKPGRGPRPIPLILSHGWPWTFWHFSKVLDPLADPGAFGGDPADAFDVIVPSLPGFGFPGPLTGFPDVNFWKVADLWHLLMTRTLGHDRYAAGGCDIGGLISSQLGHKYADHLYGIHIGSGLPLDFFNGPRAWDFARGRPLTDDQPDDVRARIVELDRRSAVHLSAHMLDGATLAHGLSDSPAGLLAWLLERWSAWSDNGGDVESVFTKDDLLTHATIYWVNNSAATSMRYYANANRHPWTPSHDRTPVVQAPAGLTFVGYENPPGVHTAEQRVRWFENSPQAAWFHHVNVTAHDRGGHFIPWEVPGAWVDDLRRTFRGLRP